MTWLGMARAGAVCVALLLAPASALAHGTDNRIASASDCVEAMQGAVASALDLGCITAASGHRLHCHLASLPPMSAGPEQLLDNVQPVTSVSALPFPGIQNAGTRSAPGSYIPIAALPRFILFGNFRS